MKCFPLMPCYGGKVVETNIDQETLELTITYIFTADSHRSVMVEMEEFDLPSIGDIVVVHGPTVSWMTEEEFNQNYERIADVE